jgi:hypothetical protein
MGQTLIKETALNPMTDKQRRRIYFLLSRLNMNKEVGDEMCFEWTEGRALKISELQFIDAMNIIKYLEGLFVKPRELKNRETDTMDRKRKGLIKAVFTWYDLQGKTVSMEYVIGTICKAGGVRPINDLTETDLQRLYAEFCRKQKVQIEMNKDLKTRFSVN